MRSLLTTAALILCLLAISFGTAQAIDSEFLSYQGRLDSSGTLLNGNRDMTFRLFPTPTGGTTLWEEQALDVPVSNGLFTHLLGSVNTIPDSAFNFSELWLEVEVEGQTIGTRSRLTAVAVANRVASVDDAQAGDIAGTLVITPDQSKDIGDAIQIKNNNGDVVFSVKVNALGKAEVSLFDPVDSKEDLGAVSAKGVQINSGGMIGFDSTAGFKIGGHGTPVPVLEQLQPSGALILRTATNSYLRFDVGGTTETVLITSSGNVGIGTTAPARKLEISDGFDSGIRVTKTGSGAGSIDIIQDGSVPRLFGPSGSNFYLGVTGDAAGLALTLKPGGNVGIGTTSPAHPLHMGSGAHCTAGGTWTNASSKKYKTDIEPLQNDEYSEILEKFEKLDVVRFKYKADPSREHIGLIAEDVPEEITSDDRTGIPTADAIAFLMAAVKAQQAQIKELKETISVLTANNGKR